MTRREKLEQIIDLETPHANDGCPRARSLVVNAQAELDDLDRWEWSMRVRQFDDEQEREWRSEERNWGVESERA